MERGKPTQVFYRLMTRVLSVLSLYFLVACSNVIDDPPPIPDNNKLATGVLTGAAIGAVVGSMSTGVPVPITTAIGGITGGAIGMAMMEKEPLLSELDRDHVQIIRIGEEVMVVLPADSYFYPNSSHMNENFYPALDRLAEFLREYETENIKVAGYTDNVGDEVRNLALSRQQAQNIANYLWRQGLDSRMIYSIGYGCQYPIATNATDEGKAFNRRVQITFRYVPEDIA